LPQSSLSSKKFIDCLFQLGLGIKRTLRIEPDTGKVSLLISCEEMRKYRVTSIEELKTSQYRSAAIGNLRTTTEQLRKDMEKELLRVDNEGAPIYFSKEEALKIVASMTLIDPVDERFNPKPSV
jgi:hypothetical protein